MADLIEKSPILSKLTMCINQSESDWDDGYNTGIAEAMQYVKNAPAVNRWISVEDALPEIKDFHISDTVLCYCDSGALAIARLEANGFGQVGFNCEKDDEYHHVAGKVLYWMPIPEIPEPNKAERINDE